MPELVTAPAVAETPPPILSQPRELSPFDVLTLTEAAAYLKLPETLVRAEAEMGAVVGRRIGPADWRFARADVLAWLRRPVPVFDGPEETPEEQEAFLELMRQYRLETGLVGEVESESPA